MSDQDMERWASAWRDDPQTAAADLARMAHRERFQLSAWITFDWILGAALLAFSAWLWIDDGSPVMRFAAAGIGLLTLVALAFTTINWRGSFGGMGASATDFLALARSRSEARQRYVRFGWWILAADLVVIAGAAFMEFRADGAARLPAMLGMATLASAAAALILYAWGRRERRRASYLAAIERAMRADTEIPHE